MKVLEELAGLLDHATAGPQSHQLVLRTLARIDETPHPEETAVRRHAGSFAAIAGIAAIAIVALSVWALWPARAVAPPRATLLLASGDVELDGRRLGIDEVEIMAGSSLVTGKDASACVRIQPRIDVCLEADAALRIEALTVAETRIDVERGRVVAALDPLADGSRFSLSGRGVVATAVGTAFVIDVADERVVTSVLEGRVEVVAHDQAKVVEPHERATAQAERLHIEPTTVDEEAIAWSRIRRVHADGDGDRVSLLVESQPAGAFVLVDGERVGTTPVRALLLPGAHRLELDLAGHVPVRESLEVAAGTRAERRFELASRPAEPLVLPTESTAPELAPLAEAPTEKPVRAGAPRETRSATQIVEHARAMLRAGELRKAEQAYVALRKTHPKSSESHTALVALGDLYLNGLGEPRAAIRSLRRYLATGGGPLAPEARHAIVRAHRKLGDRDGEIAAIEAFLAAHPADARAAVLRTRLATLRRD